MNLWPKHIWRKQGLLTKLSIMIISVLIISISSLYLITQNTLSNAITESESDHLLNIAQMVSEEELVKQALELNETNLQLKTYARQTENQFDLDYVVIITLESLRLTHPDEALIYEKFLGNDEAAVFDGESYVSKGEGSLGASLRAFVPIYQNEEIIGGVVTGKTNDRLGLLNRKFNQQISSGLSLSIVIGIAFATWVAVSIKRQLFNMEPEEIAQRFEERNAMVKHTHDAVIVTNQRQQITLANNEAIQQFNLPQTSLQPKLTEVLPDLTNLLNTHTTRNTDTVYRFNDKDFIVSHAPIVVNEQKVGHIYILRDATEIYSVLNQLYSTAEFAQSLQTQSHNFLNKLHIIYGLVELDEYEQLQYYLDELISQETDLTQRISVMVHNPILAGQLIGESRRLSQNIASYSISLLTEIPNNNQPQLIQIWLTIVEEIHNHLIKHHPQSNVQLAISYERNCLITDYQIAGAKSGLATWLQDRHWQAQLNLIEGPNHLRLSITTAYNMEEDTYGV
ncbi:Spo0B domain-containing protein [Fundicoccus ignavus]|uniref:Histidine kinase n=1 Tax=Fundicoccus ignavus TaxID=2664442 RepID=A0A844C2K2_9LACT|nr:Spo0B domain-containing protein [Fundicoccus ignavus]MRJ48449.1 hypothetical protein [Fundicoccus ignavus]